MPTRLNIRESNKQEYNRLYYSNNRDRIRKQTKEYYIKHRSEMLKKMHEYSQVWWKQNRIRECEKAKERNHKLKQEVLSHYSPDLTCQKCGYSNISALSIDHINGNGNKHRREIKLRGGGAIYRWLKNNHYPSGFQVLCMNCQYLKRTENNEFANKPVFNNQHIITKRYNDKIREKIFKHYSDTSCQRCNYSDIRALSIDHIKGRGMEHRKSLGLTGGIPFYRWIIKNDYPKEFQVLCQNCQFIKRSENMEFPNLG